MSDTNVFDDGFSVMHPKLAARRRDVEDRQRETLCRSLDQMFRSVEALLEGMDSIQLSELKDACRAFGALASRDDISTDVLLSLSETLTRHVLQIARSVQALDTLSQQLRPDRRTGS